VGAALFFEGAALLFRGAAVYHVTGGGSVTIHVTHGGKEEKGGTMCKLCDMFLVSYCKHTASKQCWKWLKLEIESLKLNQVKITVSQPLHKTTACASNHNLFILESLNGMVTSFKHFFVASVHF
jgi:hypothetical protein